MLLVLLRVRLAGDAALLSNGSAAASDREACICSSSCASSLCIWLAISPPSLQYISQDQHANQLGV